VSAPPSLIAIKAAVADAFDLPGLGGRDRTPRVARARQAAMWLAVRLTGETYAAIGTAFGRDRTTVRHAFQAIEAALLTDAGLAETIELIRLRLTGEADWPVTTPGARAVETALAAFDAGAFSAVRKSLVLALRELAPASPMLWQGT
jgi:hypothetical protein